MTDASKNETFYYAFADSAVGAMLVATGPRGIAAVLLGSDRARLIEEARGVLPDGSLLIAAPQPDATADAVARLVGGRRTLDLPLDVRGTPLERAVWAALQAIPAGATTSYGALAKTLPLPATAQEVGAACAANRIAVVIPCHRVVKADGAISGYRWGVHRKRKLLALEAAA